MPQEYSIGQTVMSTLGGRRRPDLYEIVRLLPESPDGDRHYLIRSVMSGAEQVVREAHLRAL